MDAILNYLGIIVGATALFFIAFPDLLFPVNAGKTRKVGPAYWGVYDGKPDDEPADLKKIEIKKGGRKEKVVAGGIIYAKGRNTGLRL